jgi:flagellar hook-basal body complex protein FliE
MQSSLISNVNNLDTVGSLVGAAGMGRQAPMPFSGLINDAVSNIQSLEDQASSAVEGLMNGSGVDIHQAMIAAQKANLSFELALAVRTKAVAAYQQIMQMQF